MDCPEFLCMKLGNFPDNIIKSYNLMENVHAKGFLILRVKKGMHGLPYTGIIVHKLLLERLRCHDYTESDKTPGF